MRQWRLLYDEPTLSAADGAAHMATDEAIMRAVGCGDAPPTLRVYGWQQPTLSLGAFQRGDDVDRARVVAFGWGAVRRPTGGRAVLHADELTYSVALPITHLLAAGSVVASYRRLSAALLAAVERLGAAQADASESIDADTGRKVARNPVCFAAASHYEIGVGGRKLIGSAQLRRKDALLQHGSLPLAGDIGRIVDALVYPDAAAREAARAEVRARALTLADALGGVVAWADAADAVIVGFMHTFGVTFGGGVLSAGEREDVWRLLDAGAYAV